MILSARPTVPPVAITILTWNLSCFAIFWKVGTEMCENKYHYRQGLWAAEWITCYSSSFNEIVILQVFGFILLFLTRFGEDGGSSWGKPSDNDALYFGTMVCYGYFYILLIQIIGLILGDTAPVEVIY